MKWKKFDKFESHKKPQEKSDKIYARFIQTLTTWILHRHMENLPFETVEFMHAFSKLSGNTRRLFTKLFEELVSHYFSYFTTFCGLIFTKAIRNFLKKRKFYPTWLYCKNINKKKVLLQQLLDWTPFLLINYTTCMTC